MFKAWLCGLCLVPLMARAQGQVLLFPAVGTEASVTLSGRVLKSQATRGSSKLSKNLRLLLVQNDEGAEVEVKFEGLKTTVASGHDGYFETTFSAPAAAPFPTGIHNATAATKVSPVATATVDVISAKAPFFVVSDFDDTLAISNVTSTRNLIKAAFLQDETTQPVVDGMADFYACLKAVSPDRPVFALVSGSPVQFTPRIEAFLSRHSFPVFGQYLRDIGPGTLNGYKQPFIRSLLKSLPQDVVLVGDSGEHDPEVYGQMKKEFPGRVKAIYIRDAGNAADPKRFDGMLLFNTPDEAARDAVTRGIADAACVKERFPVKEKK